jgi:hypothetical protein
MRRLAMIALPIALVLALAGCITLAPDARSIAMDNAADQVETIREQIGYHGTESTEAGFRDFVIAGGAGFGRIAIDLSDAELAELSFDGTGTTVYGAHAEGGRGVVETVVFGKGESGGGGLYEYKIVYTCFTLSWELTSGGWIELTDVDCPEAFSAQLDSHERVTVRDID